ncbi:MAG: transketolase [Candidatus Neptunochlamydia sp.]|nr:transketolase [Candidatus Neptunochlamydia sp.]
MSDLQKLAAEIRYQLILMAKRGKAAHLGSSLSCVDLIVAAYWNYLNISPKDPQNRLRDRFILSKGHAITALYGSLAEKGFFAKELLKSFNQDGGCLPEHPSPQCVPGIEMATGSLGHGLSVGLGQALAGKILGEAYRVMILLSDGECNEGSVWEAALFAPTHGVNNLTVVIDYNKWQATGRSDEVMQLSPLKNKWESFGWQTLEIEGNSLEEISAAYSQISPDKPTAIIAHTIKGKGVSFMEDDNNWHYRIPNDEEIVKAKEELGVS